MAHFCMAVLGVILLWPCGALAQDSGKTLNDVWLESGGARLQYNALTRPRQVNVNGARWEDPALVHRMGPLHEPEKKRPARQRRARNTQKAPAQAAPAAGVSAPAPVAAKPTPPPAPARREAPDAAKTAPAATAAPAAPAPSGAAVSGAALTPPAPRH